MSYRSGAGTPKRGRVNFDELSYDDKFKTVAQRKKGRDVIVLGKYQLQKKVGRGAFGIVYKALEFETRTFVAIKRLQKDEIDENSLKNLISEVELLKTMKHENIVKYVALIESDNHVNLVLEFIESGSLLQIVRQYGEMPESIAAVYTNQMLKGLAYLHKQKVIHRDIKAANILITADGVIKLADFGIATTNVVTDGEKPSDVQNSTLEGSPFWLAPEIIQLEPPTPGCDIWSLACTIIELLTTRPPYFDMPPMSALFKIVQEDHPPLPTDISKDCADFLLKCFQKEPKDRPSAESLLAHPWIVNAVGENNEDNENIPKVTLADAKASVREHNSLNSNRKGVLDIDWTPDINGGDDEDSDYSSLISSEEDGSEGVGSWSKQRRPPNRQKTKLSKKAKVSTIARDFDEKQYNNSTNYVILITGFETRKTKLFSYTVFRMRVNFGKNSWTVYKTFNDFKQFHKQLRQYVRKHKKIRIKLPKFPPTRMFGSDKISYLKKRKAKLQKYVVELLKCSEIMRGGLVVNFLKNDGPDAASKDTNLNRGADESADEGS